MQNNDHKILYVEDDELTLTLFSMILQEVCTKLFIAKNGQDAYTYYCQNNPDIVITDLGMPKVNGMEFIKNIRKINQHTPIIVISGFSDEEKRLQAQHLGVCDYIVKPVSRERLKQSLQKVYMHMQNKSTAYKDTV